MLKTDQNENFKKLMLFIGGGIVCGFMTVGLGLQFSIPTVIALIIGMCTMVLIIINPSIGFLMTAAFVSLERFGRFTADSSIFTISLMRIIGLFTLFGLFFHFIMSNKKVRLGPELFLYLIYTCFCFFSIFYSSDPRGAVRAFGQIVSNVIFFFSVINCVRSFKYAELCMALSLIAIVIIGMYTIYDWHFGVLRATDDTIGFAAYRWSTVWIDGSEWKAGFGNVMRAIGSTSHAAVYGINLIVTVPFFFYFQRFGNRLIKIIMTVCLGIVFYNLLLTNTRAVLLMAVFATGYCYITKIFSIKPATLFLLMFSLVLVLSFTKADSFKRVLDIKNYSYKKAHALQIRTHYWEAGAKVIENNWLLGVGLGNKLEIPKYINDLVPEQTTVHNEFIQTAMDVGVFGWIVHFSFIFLILYKSFKGAWLARRLKREREYFFFVGCQIIMVCTLLYGLQADVFHFPLKGWWLVAGITLSLYDNIAADYKNEFKTRKQNVKLISFDNKVII